MALKQGIPTIKLYTNLIGSSLFREMEKFSDNFLTENRINLEKYSRKWVSDPLHQWSRQYEYPFVYEQITNYLKDQSEIKILDAGSGVTFFPYYLSTSFSNTRVDCCDFDNSLEPIFCRINKVAKSNVEYFSSDIRSLPSPDHSYDILYCISVLEHTENYETIIKEFKRVLKTNGLLIVTFDISLNRSADSISKEKAKDLIAKLDKYFPGNSQLKLNEELLESGQILTTEHIGKSNKNLLPWKYPRFLALKDILKFRLPKVRNLTCFCRALNS